MFSQCGESDALVRAQSDARARLYSSPAEYSTLGHIVLDLTNLAYRPTTKSGEQPGHPTRHVTFAMSERKTAYPARAPDMHEDEDEDDKPLVRPASRKEHVEKRRDPATDDEDLLPLVPPRLPSAAPVKKIKGPPVWQGPPAILEQEVSRDSRDRAEETSILGKKAEGEALRNIMRKLSEERNLTDLHLKNSRRKRLTWKFLEKYDLYQHVVKTCPFCDSVKPRPERSRVSGLRAEDFGDLIIVDHGSTKIGNKTFGFLIVLDGPTSHLTAHPCKSTSPSKVIAKLHE